MMRLPWRRQPAEHRTAERTPNELADRLAAERPQPPPAFKRDLRDRLSPTEPVVREPAREAEPRRPVLVVAAYLVSGVLCLAVAALGTAGVGPLA